MSRLCPRRILVPIDFSPTSKQVIDIATDLALESGGCVHLLYVWEPSRYLTPATRMQVHPGDYRTLSEMARRRADAELNAVLWDIKGRGVAEVSSRIEIGDPVEWILRDAKEGDYDLIVMGTHGRSGVSRVLLGSVAESVLREASCPVMTVPPRLGTERRTRLPADRRATASAVGDRYEGSGGSTDP